MCPALPSASLPGLPASRCCRSILASFPELADASRWRTTSRRCAHPARTSPCPSPHPSNRKAAHLFRYIATRSAASASIPLSSALLISTPLPPTRRSQPSSRIFCAPPCAIPSSTLLPAHSTSPLPLAPASTVRSRLLLVAAQRNSPPS